MDITVTAVMSVATGIRLWKSRCDSDPYKLGGSFASPAHLVTQFPHLVVGMAVAQPVG